LFPFFSLVGQPYQNKTQERPQTLLRVRAACPAVAPRSARNLAHNGTQNYPWLRRTWRGDMLPSAILILVVLPAMDRLAAHHTVVHAPETSYAGKATGSITSDGQGDQNADRHCIVGASSVGVPSRRRCQGKRPAIVRGRRSGFHCHALHGVRIHAYLIL
jgi:hypothetical protein